MYICSYTLTIKEKEVVNLKDSNVHGKAERRKQRKGGNDVIFYNYKQ